MCARNNVNNKLKRTEERLSHITLIGQVALPLCPPHVVSIGPCEEEEEAEEEKTLKQYKTKLIYILIIRRKVSDS